MIFRRRRVPAWSALEDRSAHEELLELVRDRLREVGVAVDDDEAGPVIAVGGGRSLDVAALTTAAAEAPPETWPEVVRGHVASATNPNRPPSDPARLQPTVRVRLLTVEALERFPKALPHRRHGDLAEVLVIDSSRSFVWAAAADLEPLGMDVEELFRLGRENAFAAGPVRTTTLDVAGGSITLVEGRGEYVASRALELDRLVDLPADTALVAVPTRGAVLVGPPPGGDDAVVAAMADEAAARFETGPGGVSPRLYRWADGGLTLHD